jgi:segregation and condensation protein B
MNEFYTRNVLEAALLAAGKSLTVAELGQLFDEGNRPKVDDIRTTLDALAAEYSNRGLEVKETAAGFRIQVRREFASEISRLWPERPARYSRALLETLALIAYRQPITRAEIEAVRGVAVNPNIVKTVIERNWVRVVGHRDVPGRPELLGTTREFLDYFGLRSLDELPPLAELKAMGDYNLQLELPNAGAVGVDGEIADGAAGAVALLTSDGVSAEGAGALGTVSDAGGELAAGVEGGVGDGGDLAPSEAGGAGDVSADAMGGELVDSAGGVDAVGAHGAASDAAAGASGEAVADAVVLEATFGDVTVVDVAVVEVETVAHEETAQQAVGEETPDAGDESSHHADAGSNSVQGAVADADGSHDDATHQAVSTVDADTAGAHDTVADAGGSADAAGGARDNATHQAVSTPDADDFEADRTLSSVDTSKHAAESDDSDAPEPAITSESPDALEDAADDDADEDELSADGHGSRELVAAPRDIDD